MKAGKVQWYGPEHKRGSLDDTVAHLPGVRKSVEQAARRIFKDAQVIHAHHSKTGDSQIELEGAPPRLLDWYVILRDVERSGWDDDAEINDGEGMAYSTRSAGSIEWGWTNKKTGVHYDGLHILGQAMNNAIRRHI